MTQEICPHFGICGGCQTQNLPYAEQLKKKEAFVRENLNGLPAENFIPIISSPQIYFYRNKMEFSFGDENDLRILKSKDVSGTHRVHLGLHPGGRFALVTPTAGCLLQSEESQRILKLVAEWATATPNSVYVRKNNRGILRHLVIREGKKTGERMVNLFTAPDAAQVDLLAEALRSSGIPIKTFLWTVNSGISDVAQGEVKRIFWGEGIIRERLGKTILRVGPESFMQTNTLAAEGMIELLVRWLGKEAGGEILLDLYCGSGPIGLNLCPGFNKLVGIESNETAVADAMENALRNGVREAEFHLGAVEKLLPDLMNAYSGRRKTVIVDPPRAGLHSKALEALLAGAPDSIYYVSCNPESLARDLRALVSKYRILNVQPMDFFPHTNHVETAVRMRIV